MIKNLRRGDSAAKIGLKGRQIVALVTRRIRVEGRRDAVRAAKLCACKVASKLALPTPAASPWIQD